MRTPASTPIPTKPSWRDSALWHALSDTSTALTWFQIAAAFFMLWRAQGWKMMPSLAANPIGAIAASGAVFFGTLFVVATATKLTVLSLPKLKRWRNPPLLVFIPRASNKLAAIVLMHDGYPATWEARMRITDRLDGASIEDPLTRQCLLRKDGKAFRSLLLKHGEKASLILANTIHYMPDGPHMQIQDAESTSYGEFIPPSGVIIEIELISIPGALCAIKRYFKLTSRPREIIELAEVESEELKFTEI